MLSNREFFYTIIISFTACLVGCQDDASETFDGMDEAAQVTYTYHWDRRDVTWVDSARWQITNDQGYTIQVDEGHIVNYETALVPCPIAKKKVTTPLTSLWAQFGAFFSVTTAYAGHGDVADQSALKTGFVEAIGGSSVTKTVTQLQPTTYCDIHYLVARADQTVVRDADMPDMVNRSILLEGQYKAPGGGDWTPFVVDSSIAYGALRNNSVVSMDSGSIVLGEATKLSVTLRRPMRSLFKDIDFEGMNESSIARTILKNLLDGTDLAHQEP